jgi:cytochrome d ubiquinol oxidase subunit II
LAQGITLGALLQGITIEGRAYGGGWWDWLTPFTLLVGASLVIGYALLGACWLVWKTEGPLHDQARRYALCCCPPCWWRSARSASRRRSSKGKYYERWFQAPGLFVAVPMPLLVLGTAWGAWRALRQGAGPCPVPVGAGAVRPVAARSRHLDLARRDPRPRHDLAGGRAV